MVAFSKNELIPLIVEHYQQQLQMSTYQLYTYQHTIWSFFIKTPKESNTNNPVCNTGFTAKQ